MRKTVLTILIFFMLAPVLAQRATDTFRLYFNLDIAALSPSIEKKIDLLVYNDRIINGSSIVIIGYADYLGTEGYNKNLSMRRARNVKNYLVKYGIDSQNIKLCLGKGEVIRNVVRTPDGYPTDRRVDIVVNNRPPKPPLPPGRITRGPSPRKDTGKPVRTTSFEDFKHLKPGSTLLLRNVYFPADRHVIKPESRETLEKLYTVLKDYPNIKISIEGHVCCIREAPDALDIDTGEPYLSVNRAKAIYNYLVSRGIDSTRLRYAGFGHRRPVIANERTEEDAEQNRRVEVRVLENDQ